MEKTRLDHTSTQRAPNAKLETNTITADHWTDGRTPLLLDVDAVGCGVAMGDVGEYVTPFAVAATSNTDPPPYS